MAASVRRNCPACGLNVPVAKDAQGREWLPEHKPPDPKLTPPQERKKVRTIGDGFCERSNTRADVGAGAEA